MTTTCDCSTCILFTTETEACQTCSIYSSKHTVSPDNGWKPGDAIPRGILKGRYIEQIEVKKYHSANALETLLGNGYSSQQDRVNSFVDKIVLTLVNNPPNRHTCSFQVNSDDVWLLISKLKAARYDVEVSYARKGFSNIYIREYQQC